MLTRWVGAALGFALIWLVAVIAQIVLWCWAEARAGLRGQRPSARRLRTRVAGASAWSLRWLRSAAGWSQPAAP